MVTTDNDLAGPVTPFIDANLGGTYVHKILMMTPGQWVLLGSFVCLYMWDYTTDQVRYIS